MTRLAVRNLLAAMMMALPATTWAADACCPADAAKTDAQRGGAMIQTVADAPAKEMPPGHPPMGGAGMGGMKGMGGTMPPGHPPTGGAMPTTQPSEPFQANLAVKLTQGSAGGKEPADMPVTVEFFQGGKAVHSVKTTSDAKGVVMLENVALPGNCQPLVSVTNGSVTFQATGKPMSADAADQMVRLTVFETTDEAPVWEVAMRHVVVEHVAQGALRVTEMIAVRNLGDKAWGGTVVAPAEGYDGPKRVTMKFTLPQGARHVTLGRGFTPGTSRGEELIITSWAPMLPGTTEYQYKYVIAAKDGKVDMSLPAPAITRSMMILLPEGMQATGNGEMKVYPASEKSPAMRLYEWKDLAGGAVATVKMENLGTLPPAITKPQAQAPEPAAKAEGATSSEDHLKHDHGPAKPEPSRAPRAIAGLGAGALVLGAAAFLLMKPRNKR